MNTTSAFYDIVSTIFERSFSSLKVTDSRPIEELCIELIASKDEVSGYRLAQVILDGFDKLSNEQISNFFEFLTEELDIDPEAVGKASGAYQKDRSVENLSTLTKASEPRRQVLLRKLNEVPNATVRLVRMRTKLLEFAKTNKSFKRTDLDFQHLFASWFNRGFLVLKRIDWQSPANVLEKIIQYEAVHAIDDWDDLRRRLQPADRRCYAYFHPTMPDEPLIFVEVALSNGIASSVQNILASEREIIDPENADTAVFYSISNCQAGLRGVSFGNSLIKQVVQDLRVELPHFSTFITLSPLPGFSKWFHEQGIDENNPDRLANPDEWLKIDAAEYLYAAKRDDGNPLDPVARFHLNNGAAIHALHANADTSENGINQSKGVMVNYLYDLKKVEKNHEGYATEQTVAASKTIKNLQTKYKHNA